MTELKRTPLFDLHTRLGAKMVPFAGYEMPVQYTDGVMKEHLWTRDHAGLFDVSHMGQVLLTPRSGNVDDAALALERLVPVNVLGLSEGRQRYALFTNDAGGILDDLMVTRRAGDLLIVVNAARKDHDVGHLRDHLSDACEVTVLEDRALIALQGPEAETALARLVPETTQTRFMDHVATDWAGAELWISRSGYTGEDGFEISVPANRAEALAEALLAMDEVAPVGLGARDSLRLEAGLCLYGSDIDETTSPVEADLVWAIQKVRRRGGEREGGFPGADRILSEIENGPSRRRVGLLPDGRAPMRSGTELFMGDRRVGAVTSGAYGPSIERPMSMAYVETELSEPGTELTGEVRGKRLPVSVASLPFVPARFKR